MLHHGILGTEIKLLDDLHDMLYAMVFVQSAHCCVCFFFFCTHHSCETKKNSFSWSAAIQLPLLELCREQQGGTLQLDAMSNLYKTELEIACAAAVGNFQTGYVERSDGDHVGKQ